MVIILLSINKSSDSKLVIILCLYTLSSYLRIMYYRRRNCHGDFNPSNILIDENDTPWLIDFEYCFSAPAYYDIGKLFRTRENYSQYMNEKVRNHFVNGYKAKSQRTLPEDWYRLSKIADIVGLLALINRENIPLGWIEEIEEEIRMTMSL